MNALDSTDKYQGSPFRDLAVRYCLKGFSPLPIVPGAKRPCIAGWQEYAESRPRGAELRSWMQEFPAAGLGLALGMQVNPEQGLHLAAVDVDQDELVEPVKALLFDGQSAGAAFVAKRGSKGLTIFVLAPGDITGRKFPTAQGMGVEILCGGQQTVLPPTIHPKGMQYEWVGECGLLDVDLTQLPVLDPACIDSIQRLVEEQAPRVAVAANDNPESPNDPVYLGNGRFENVHMVYPGNVHDTQLRMAAKAAHWDYKNDRLNEEGREEAIQGMVTAAYHAYDESEATEPWDYEKQCQEAASQYDSAVRKWLPEWEQSAKPEKHVQLNVIRPVAYQGQEPPPRRWLVDQWLPFGHVTALYGDGGMGKSILALQLMTACAVGRRWLGLRTEPCRVFGVFCEDDPHELMRRQAKVIRVEREGPPSRRHQQIIRVEREPEEAE